MRDPDATVYVSSKKLANTDAPQYHADEDCHQVASMDDVTEMTVAEAREQCARQAQCCSTIVALEDLD